MDYSTLKNRNSWVQANPDECIPMPISNKQGGLSPRVKTSKRGGKASFTEPHAQKDLKLDLMFCCCALEILSKFNFEFACFKWSPMGQWGRRVNRGILSVCISCPSTCIQGSQWPLSTELQQSHWGGGKTQNKYQISMPCPQLSRGTDSPEMPCFLFEPELISNTERRKWHSKK